MKYFNCFKSFGLVFAMCCFVEASCLVYGDDVPTGRSDAHAPIGVVGDHMHDEREWMASYRYMYMNMENLASGTDGVSKQDVFHRGFERVPIQMEMQMHMLGLMYAPSDRITLMAMAHYVVKEMDMVGPAGGGMHGHGMQGQMKHGAGVHHHSTEGWGDTVITGLIHLWKQGAYRVHAGLGIGLPTAGVEEKMAGIFQPYGMQLGHGVWDFRPSLTYLGSRDVWSWGGQASARVNLEDENDAGFAFGDQVGLTAWGARMVHPSASVSVRVSYDHQDAIEGVYNGPHSQAAPPHQPSNYGGDVVGVGAGLNLMGREGILRGHRLAVEYLVPVYQDVNGIQLERDYSVLLGWQKAW